MAPLRVVEGVAASHRAVELAVSVFDDDTLGMPSLRDGWTIGDVVASLAGNDGAERSSGRLLDDLRRQNGSLDDAFASSDGDTEAALLRWREVVVGHTDLGVGYDWNDWPADYVRLDLDRMTMLWNSRRPMGLTGLPPAALQAPPALRLAWLLGRSDIDSLSAVAPW